MNTTTQLEINEAMVRRSLELAARGIGQVSPNPLVGCVIVSSDGEVVGEGTYRRKEITHAEVIALQQAGVRARGGTAYVSLEPHDHHGKTPPCTEALIVAGIKRVVCPMEDPNPLVSGKGFEKLRQAGIEVVVGALANDAKALNEKFIVWHRKERPFVHLKLAMSLDGRISLDGSVSTALSGALGRQRVQQIRHEHDAILVGGNTVSVDDPALTDRSGLERARPLVRIVLDNRLQTPLASKLAQTARETPTMIFTNSRDDVTIGKMRSLGVDIIESDMGGRDLPSVLQELRKRDIQSVLVEGGTEIAGSFIDCRLVDKVSFIISPMIIGGREAPNAIGGMGALELSETTRLNRISFKQHGEDIEITAYPVN